MPAVPITIDGPGGRIYAGTPANPDGELPTVTIADDVYRLSPTGQYLISETADPIPLGQTGPSTLIYTSYREYQLTTPIGRSSINDPISASVQRAFGGTVDSVLPDGTVVSLPVEGVVLTPEGSRLAITYDIDGNPSSVYVRSDLRTVDELRETLNDPLARFAQPLETVSHGLIKHLYQHESSLLKDIFESHVMEDEGLPDTYSGAAAWLIRHAELGRTQTYTQRFW